jgi:acyl dehydratase
MPLDHALVGKASDSSKTIYTWEDTVLYALGIGAKRDELDYVYEGRGPKVYPSFAVVPKFEPMLELLAKTGGNMAMIVHGAERVSVRRAFAGAGTLHTTATIRGIYDMRKFASVLVDTETKNEAGAVVATTTSSILFRGEGGFGGQAPPKEVPVAVVPKGRAPDFRVEEKTSLEQALLYRLSGDFNPLHADPEFAASVGFEQGPILHGLCTFGYMVRHVAKEALGGDASRFTAFEAQFRKPVWPGETLVTEGWFVGPRTDATAVAVAVSVKERGETVLSNAWASYAAAPA